MWVTSSPPQGEDNMVLEPIRNYLKTIEESLSLYFAASPKVEIGKTKYKEQYEKDLSKLGKELERKMERLEEKPLEETYRGMSRLFNKYIKKYKDLQERYLEKVKKLKEERQGQKFKEEVA